jgi:hypothetical protein
VVTLKNWLKRDKQLQTQFFIMPLLKKCTALSWGFIWILDMEGDKMLKEFNKKYANVTRNVLNKKKKPFTFVELDSCWASLEVSFCSPFIWLKSYKKLQLLLSKTVVKGVLIEKFIKNCIQFWQIMNPV